MPYIPPSRAMDPQSELAISHQAEHTKELFTVSPFSIEKSNPPI
jgi:hypothetical protein